MGPSAPPVNHLLFVDDRLVFLKASQEGAEEVPNLLHIYCKASGQKVNKKESLVFFRKNVPALLRRRSGGFSIFIMSHSTRSIWACLVMSAGQRMAHLNF